ncbi:MAG: hypothetical protein ACKOEX_09730 [Planctomycetia bacterium]
MVETFIAIASLLMAGIEAAYVPTEDGAGDYLVRVEPDLVRNASPYTFTSDVPADSRNVRRVKIYVADAWPPAVERAVLDASKRPRIVPAATTAPLAAIETGTTKSDRPWPFLIGSLIALFLSLGANGYLGMLLATMRARYIRDIHQAAV